MRPSNDAPRVLVSDVQDRTGLAAIRCLSSSGYRVTAVGIRHRAPGFRSRGCSAKVLAPDPHLGVEDYVRALERIVRRERHVALLAGTDETLHAISTRRDRLAPYVPLGLPSRQAVQQAFDKRALAREAAKVGLDAPEGRLCRDYEQAAEAARDFGFPVIIKGLKTIDELDGRLIRYPSRWTPDEAWLRHVQPNVGPCIVQRPCNGSVISFGGVMTEDGLLASAVSRYRRTWPPSVGSASFSETISAPEGLAERVAALVDALGWRGLFELELIEDSGGALRAIDFNPRLYGSIWLARTAGAPLSTVWCDWLLKRSPSLVTARPGVAYRWEEGETRHALWRLRRGDVAGAVAVVRPRRGAAHPYFQARDPLPFFAYCVEAAVALWRRWTRSRR